MEIDGRPASAWHGFRFGDVESYYQAGRAPEFDEYSLGLILLVHSMRMAAEDGMREYRFLRGEGLFKRRLATRTVALEGLALGGPIFAAGLRVKTAASRLLATLSAVRRSSVPEYTGVRRTSDSDWSRPMIPPD